jgi:hypothetical protein
MVAKDKGNFPRVVNPNQISAELVPRNCPSLPVTSLTSGTANRGEGRMYGHFAGTWGLREKYGAPTTNKLVPDFETAFLLIPLSGFIGQSRYVCQNQVAGATFSDPDTEEEP